MDGWMVPWLDGAGPAPRGWPPGNGGRGGRTPPLLGAGPPPAEPPWAASPGLLAPARGGPVGSDSTRPSWLVAGRPVGRGVLFPVSFSLSFKRKKRGKRSSRRMHLLQVDVRVCGTSRGSPTLIPSRDSLS